MNKKAIAVQTAIALGLSATTFSSAVVAQNAGFTLEEVIVTAQKRDQSLQDVPISVQAFSSETIREIGANVVSDLQHIAPSFQMGGLGGGSQQHFGIRGVVDYGRNVGVDSRMGVYIDGVFQGRSYSADQPLIGLETVEVLRGPQGTLFGKNTVSGAINLTTKTPTETTEGEFQVEYGNEGYVRASAYLSGQVSQNFFASASVARDENDGFFKNLALNKDTGSYERTSWRTKFLWNLSDAMDVTLATDGSDYQSKDVVATRREEPAFTTTQGYESNEDTSFWGSSLTIDYAMGDYQISSITAIREGDYKTEHDDDLLPLDIQISYRGEDTEQFSQEIRLISPKNDKYDWVAGVYYYDSTAKSNNSSCFGVDLYNVVIAPLAPFAAALTGCTYVPSKITSEMSAVYFHGNYRFNEQLELTAGLRYTSEDKGVAWEQYSEVADPATAAVLQGATGLPLTQAPGALFGAINYDRLVDDRSENDVSPTVGLNYFASDNVMLYAKYSGAFKSGGYNSEFMLAGLEYFEYDDETVDSYELGLKSTLLDGKLRLNATIYRSEFDDYQVFQFLTNASGATSLQLTNAGQVTSEGYEFEATYLPTANLRLTLNTAYVDASYDRFENPVPGEASFTGNKLPYAPEFKLYAGVQYSVPMGEQGNMIFNLDYSQMDDQFSDPSNSAVDTIDSYDLWNARVAWTPSDESWELALWGKNLADEEYNAINNDNFLGTPRTVWGAPRLYGLSFTYFMGN